MLTGPPRRRRARPVADAPIEALLERTEDLTKGWLLALLERAPLDDAPRILAADLTREGPRVCAAMLRAIADETDHRRLEPGGALQPLVARVGELAGAAGAAATSLAVDALQSVMWSALRSELRDPDPDLITELAERLSQVTGLMRAAALEHGSATATLRPPISAVPALRPRGRRRGRSSRRVPAAAARRLAAAGRPSPPPAARGRQLGSPPLGADGPAASAEDPAGPRRGWDRRRRTRPRPAAPGRELWVDALEDEIRAAADAPLSLLLAELEDADRVRAVETDRRCGDARGLRRVRRAPCARSRATRTSSSVRPTPGRGSSPGTPGGPAPRRSARGSPPRCAPASPGAARRLSASVGVAVLGEDGRSAAELIEAAEEARFAAAAEGVDVLRAAPGDRARPRLTAAGAGPPLLRRRRRAPRRAPWAGRRRRCVPCR